MRQIAHNLKIHTVAMPGTICVPRSTTTPPDLAGYVFVAHFCRQPDTMT